MKSIKQIAEALMLRRNQMSQLMMPGHLVPVIGQEGLNEAVRRNWLCPDFDSGALTFTSNLNKLEEMKQIAECDCAKCHKAECECDGKKETSPVVSKTGPSEESRRRYINHAGRGITEFAAPGSGQPDPAAGPSVPPPAPQSMPVRATASPDDSQDPAVGSQVVVAENGRSFAAVVQSREADGTYTLSFGGERPSTQRNYRREELQLSDAK